MKPKNQKQLIKLGEQLEKNPIVSQSNTPIKSRNYLALNPLLQKGGLHDKDDLDQARKRQRRQTKQSLRKQDWLTSSHD
ncbi:MULTISPECIES: hypothetical protein [unclassified Moraxella]|uniref:hypothetical protein n=1 Tax=unclassified Moraxella TaxID=2685852 RepID=UPI003AF57B1F